MDSAFRRGRAVTKFSARFACSNQRHDTNGQKAIDMSCAVTKSAKVKRFDEATSKHSEENYGDEKDNWQDDADGTQNWPQDGSR
jgi:hypothetical protein